MALTRNRAILVALVAVGGALPVLQYWSAGGALLTPTPVGIAPFRPTPRYEELALFSAVLIIKPLYSLLSLALILLLTPFKAPDAVALRWGLVSFFVGEGACAVNILFFRDSAYLLEFLHMYGMATSLAFVAYAALEAADARLINFSHPEKKCAALSLCRRRAKYVEAPCGVERLFYFLIPVLMVLAFIPLLTSPQPTSYTVQVLGIPYTYSHQLAYQIFEIHYSPVYALVLLGASLTTLLVRKNKTVEIPRMLLAAGMGPLGFAFLRLIFVNTYRENLVWLTFWEEVTELIYVAGIAFVLWAFHRGPAPRT